jgi:NHLM bacteriocin system ABC transporter ATP-binding protein
LKRLLEQSEKISVEGNRPLVLDDPEKVWVVQEGRIEVFAVRLKAGEPFGHRSHIFTANPGDTIWGVSPEKHEEGLALMATGPYGTLVAELALSEVIKLSRETESLPSVVSLVESWIRSAVGGIANPVLPKNYIELEEAEDFTFKEGVYGLCKKDVLWIKHGKGGSVFRGREDTDLTVDSGFFPLTGRGCIRASQESLLEVKSTAKLFSEGDAFGEIKGFNGRMLEIVKAYEDTLTRREEHRMSDRIRQDDRILRTSMRSLTEVMRPWREGEAVTYAAESPLLAACRLVGQKSRIDIKVPRGEGYVQGRQDLEAIANASRMRIRQVILKDLWWRSDCGPLLGFLEDEDRPVALIPASKTSYRLCYPETGERIPINAQIAQTVKPFAYSFYRSFPPKALGAWDLLKFGFKSAWKSDFAIIIVLGLLGGLLGMITPIATGFIFDTIIPQAERVQLTQLGLFLLTSALASFLFQIARAIAMLRSESRMNVAMQAAMWDRLLSLPVPFFRRFTSGDLATRAGGVNAIRRALSSTVMNSIFSGIFSLFNFILLFFYSSFLAWRAALLVLLSVLITALSSWITLRYQREIAEISGKLNGTVLQIIAAVSKFRVSGAEKRAYHLWSRDFSKRRKLQFKAESVSNGFSIWNAIFPVAASMVLFYLVVSSEKVELSIGNFLAFNSAFTNFTGSMLSLSGTLIGVLAIVPVYNRTKPILETLPEDDESKSDPGELRGNIEVGHVKFRYDPDGPVILDDIYLNVGQGEFVALVGPSGSGKSTLLRMLLGFEEPESGAVYYDGQDLSTLDLRSVRNQIGVVLQNGKVLSGDIFSNIIGASTHLTVQDAWDAAEAAGLADDIRAMPMGMYTYISEGGTTLSGGQRQRLLIARAVVNKPRIIFFDEATSALDNRTQEIVSRSLERLNATRVVIAHRLSTVMNADRIVVLFKGRIVQEGPYDQLIEEEGTFAELAKRQLAE